MFENALLGVFVWTDKLTERRLGVGAARVAKRSSCLCARIWCVGSWRIFAYVRLVLPGGRVSEGLLYQLYRNITPRVDCRLQRATKRLTHLEIRLNALTGVG